MRNSKNRHIAAYHSDGKKGPANKNARYVLGVDPYDEKWSSFTVFDTWDKGFRTSAEKNPMVFEVRRRFFFSVKPISKCLFSRRYGYKGKRILGYSVCLRLFGKDIL